MSGFLKLDSGLHPNLYKIGMRLQKVSPRLWDYGTSMLTLPERLSSGYKFRFGDRQEGRKIDVVNLELSVICNLRCTMCWWWGSNGIAFKLVRERDPLVTQELSTQEIFDLVDQLAGKHRPSFYLSGGEPFIRKDTVDIIEYITGKGMSVITNNNGTMLSDDKLERLSRIRNLTINFSIDGPRDVHDNIRGKGMFDKTTETIRKLLDYRGENALPGIKTNTTFSPWIAGRLDELIRYLQDDVGVDGTRLQHLWFTDKNHAEAHKKVLKMIFGSNEGEGVDSHIISTFDAGYVQKLSKEIMDIEKKKYRKPVFIHPRLTQEQIVKYYSDLSFTKRDRCFVAWNYLMVKANGDAMFCPDEWMTDFKLGNVRNKKVDELWGSDAARKFREELYKRKLFPACARCCAIN